MAYRYSIADARANLSGIIDQAEAGEAVELTRRGQPVAVVLSCAAYERLLSGRPRFGDAYRAFLERFPVAEVGIDDELFATVRDRSPGRKVKL
jgi:PTS system cellobiose-specific IIB component